MRAILLVLLAINLTGCAYYFGNSWQNSFNKIEKTRCPKFAKSPERLDDAALKEHPLVLHWANKELKRPETKRQRGPERLMLAKLIAHQDVNQVNNYLLKSIPWGNSGTSGKLNPLGDYDFTSIILAAILHRFKDDPTILWNNTEEHLARVLLIEEGGKPHKKTPRVMGVMKDTENHILMTNISQYLKNQWLIENGETNEKYDNRKNGLEQFLLNNLEELHITGQYEFNSKPYEGYTISALLVLHACVDSEPLRAKAQEVLDSWAWEYMQTSYKFRKSAPFRRRMARFKSTSLQDNASTSIMQAWYLEHTKGVFRKEEIPHNHHQALSALVYDYRPPTEIWQQDDAERLLLVGHGKGSSPEIHSRGEGFLLSAGGFQRGEASQLVARPIVLMLNDLAVEHLDCFHINGKGKWQSWNNTGVYHRFAVGEQKVEIPKSYSPIDSIGNWSLFVAPNSVEIIVYSTDGFGVIFIPKTANQFEKIVAINSNIESINVFKSADLGTIQFNVKSPKGKWVIESVNDEELNRKTDTWKRVDVFSF